MISLLKVNHAKLVHLSAMLLMLLFSLASLVSCNQPAPPQYTSLNLDIPPAALQSPVKGPLPDTTELHVGITFKVDPRLLDQADHLKLQPGQLSNLEVFAKRIGIDDATYQKIANFFNPEGITLKLSKLRTYLSVDAKAGTLARLLQTTFVLHQ
jgi:kumamolisin